MTTIIYVCKCGLQTESGVRHNPTTGHLLLLCPAHTELHDDGRVFEVVKFVEES